VGSKVLPEKRRQPRKNYFSVMMRESYLKGLIKSSEKVRKNSVHRNLMLTDIQQLSAYSENEGLRRTRRIGKDQKE